MLICWHWAMIISWNGLIWAVLWSLLFCWFISWLSVPGHLQYLECICDNPLWPEWIIYNICWLVIIYHLGWWVCLFILSNNITSISDFDSDRLVSHQLDNWKKNQPLAVAHPRVYVEHIALSTLHYTIPSTLHSLHYPFTIPSTYPHYTIPSTYPHYTHYTIPSTYPHYTIPSTYPHYTHYTIPSTYPHYTIPSTQHSLHYPFNTTLTTLTTLSLQHYPHNPQWYSIQSYK